MVERKGLTSEGIADAIFDERHHSLIESLTQFECPVNMVQGQPNSFSIDRISHPLTVRELKSLTESWRDAIVELKPHKKHFKIDRMVIAWFSTFNERTFDEDRLIDTDEDPMILSGVAYPIPIDSRERFHLKWNDELLWHKDNLDRMGYVDQKNKIWIPCNRIINMKITLI